MQAESNRTRDLRSRLDRVLGVRQALTSRQSTLAGEIEELDQALEQAGPVRAALETLTNDLFDTTLKGVEDDLSLALQEVFEDPTLRLCTTKHVRRGKLEVDFHMERNGEPEDLLRGQGGSVLNVVSTGLRMIAIAAQDHDVHRPFLILDEQDCWLRPDRVPLFTQMVAEAASGLDLQVLLITHHDVALVADHVDKAYRLESTPNGVQARIHPLRGQTSTWATERTEVVDQAKLKGMR